MPPLPTDTFAARVRDLSSEELASFCAALWAARGWQTERRPDGAVVARRGGERKVLTPVPAGFRARRTDPVSADATTILAIGQVPPTWSEDAEVLDTVDLYEMVLYGLPRERADAILREYLGVSATVPAGFDETLLKRAVDAVDATRTTPYARELIALVLVVFLVLGAAMILPSDPRDQPIDAGGNGSETTTTTVETDSVIELADTPNWSTALGRSPDEWPVFGGGPARTAWRPSVDGPSGSVSPLLGRSTGRPITASPVVANGTVYVGLDTGILAAYGLTRDEDLRMRWQLHFDGAITSSPAVDGDTVYFGTVAENPPTARAARNREYTASTQSFQDRQNLYAVNATNGVLRWSYAIPSVDFSSPVVVGNTLYVGGTGGNVHAVNASDGVARWRAVLGSPISTSPAVANGTVYAAASNGVTAALNASTGTPLWSRNESTSLGSSPAVHDRRVYLGTERGSVLALDARTGATVWNTSVDGPIYSSPATTPERVYVGTENGSFYALNASTGEIAWRQIAAERRFTSPVVANGTIYVGVAGGNGSVLALNARTGRIAWRYDAVGQVTSSPAVVPGLVVVGDYDGHVHLLGRGNRSSAVARSTPPDREIRAA